MALLIGDIFPAALARWLWSPCCKPREEDA